MGSEQRTCKAVKKENAILLVVGYFLLFLLIATMILWRMELRETRALRSVLSDKQQDLNTFSEIEQHLRMECDIKQDIIANLMRELMRTTEDMETFPNWFPAPVFHGDGDSV